jgi:hypothetical protein
MGKKQTKFIRREQKQKKNFKQGFREAATPLKKENNLTASTYYFT